MPAELTLFFSFLFFLNSSVFSLIFLFSFFFFVIPCFYFLVFKFSILSSFSSSSLLYTAKALFYNVCRDWIFLFQPLTSFVWSGCTCQPPYLCAAPYHQTKRTILFVSLPWHPLLAMVWVPFISLSLIACTQQPSSTLPVWVVCHPGRTLPPKKPWQEPQNRSSPLPTTKPCPFISDP